jgi:lysophospholipase L1-like esterase
MAETGARIAFWRRLLFWALLPISGLQGLLLRRSARRLPPPPAAVSGSCGQGAPVHVLAAGDSIIAGIGAARQEQTLPVQFAEALASVLGVRVDWHVEGKNGLNLADLLLRLVALEPGLPADVILISIGVNDVTGLSTTRRWRRQLRLLAQVIRSRWPHALVVFAGLPPMGRFPLPPQPLRFSLGLRAGIFDRIAIEVLAGQNRMMHIATEIDSGQNDFCADGFHPSADSYAVWADELAQRVASQVQAPEADSGYAST